MISAFITIYIACWTYQGGVRSGATDIFKWAAIATIVFFAIQLSWLWVDNFLFLSETRPTWGPRITGFLIAAFIRTKLLMRASLTPRNLFSHLNIFQSTIERKHHLD